jgi:hypothetical protein
MDAFGRALNVNAVDYLVKLFSEKPLLKANDENNRR